MSSRHALVVGSNCAGLPANQLDYVAGDTKALFDVLTSPTSGVCDPLNSTLLVDPTLRQLADEVKASIRRAASAGASLVFSFLGHGVAVGGPNVRPELYLLPIDGSEHPDSDSGYHLGNRLREILGSADAQGLDGLLLLLDVCHGGIGLLDCARDAAAQAAAADVRLEMLAAVFDLKARGGCFTKTLTEAARNGLPDLSSDYFTATDAADLLAQRCSTQEAPLRFAMARGRRVLDDPSLWIAKNSASAGTWSLSNSHAGGLAVDLTRRYVLTKALTHVVRAMDRSQLACVTGGPGLGKSAVVAALARPEVVPHLVPKGFLTATAFAALTPTSADLAHDLRDQLLRNPQFRSAVSVFEQSFEFSRELAILSPLERSVLGPLSRIELPETESIRIAIDGVDLLPQVVRRELMMGIARLIGDEAFDSEVRFLFTSRTTLPELAAAGTQPQVVELTAPERPHILSFLREKNPDAVAPAALVDNIDSWIELVVLTESSHQLELTAIGLPASKEALYTAIIEPLLADDVAAVAAVLAAAGAGPVLPVTVLMPSAHSLGGPSTSVGLADVMAALGRLVSRSKPGTEDEHVGLSHESLVAWVRSHQFVRWRLEDAHRAILAGLDLAEDDAAQAYRLRARADHLWAVGDHQTAAEAVIAACGSVSADNVALLHRWVDQARKALPEPHPATLALALEHAKWVGKSGAMSDALELIAAVATELERLFDPDSRESLRARLLQANFSGRTGDVVGARDRASTVAALSLGRYGMHDQLSLEAQAEVARWDGNLGKWKESLNAHRDILERREATLGREHPDTQASRANIAYALGKLGQASEAATAFAKLADEQEASLGRTHRNTLNSRLGEIRWLGEAGSTGQQVQKCYLVIPALQEALGPDDPMTLSAYSFLAQGKAVDGQLREALRVIDHLLPKYNEVLGATATETFYARINRACWTARVDSLERGHEELIRLVEEISLSCKVDDDALLHARSNLAYWTARSGAVEAARTMYEALVEDLGRIRGSEHKSTKHAERLLRRVANIRRPDSADRDRTLRAAPPTRDADLERLLPAVDTYAMAEVATFDDFAMGQVRRARVTLIVDFGVFVDVDGFRGLIHVSELSWARQASPWELVAPGDELTVVVSRINADSRQVAFSHKQAVRDPLTTFIMEHPLGSTVSGTVLAHTRSGTSVSLPDDLLGLIPTRRGRRRVPPPLGKQLELAVMDVDPETRIVILGPARRNPR